MAERDKARTRVFSKLLLNAVLRWESFVTLLMTAILYIAVPEIQILGLVLPAWVWLILGGAAEAALVWSTLTDPEETQEALAREFENKYDLGRIRNSESRDRLRTAMEYRRNILELVKRRRGSMRTNLLDTVEEINDWIHHMYDLALHIDAFESNELVSRDLREVPRRIARVKSRIEQEEDERVRDELERQLKQLERQKINLEATRNGIRRAEIQLESTLTSLGTIYAQMSLMGTKEVDSSSKQRLIGEMKDEINQLQDTLEAMDEVQMQSLQLR
jgi:hypothetical protein